MAMAAVGRTVACLATAVLVAGCAGWGDDGRTAGAAAGAGIGAGIGRAAAIGTRYPWAFAGTGLAAGAAVGAQIGEYADPPLSRMWAEATVTAAEAARPGQPVAWSLRGHSGQVTMVGEPWVDGGGRACRALHQQSGTGEDGFSRLVVACRSQDGTWEVVLPPDER